MWYDVLCLCEIENLLNKISKISYQISDYLRFKADIIFYKKKKLPLLKSLNYKDN